MDFLSQNQIIGIIMFVIGGLIMSRVTKYERKIDSKVRDPKMKWAVIDGQAAGMMRKKTIIGTTFSVFAFLLSVSGLIMFILEAL